MKKNKMSLTTELDLTREGTAEMTRWCILIALHQSFGIGAARLNKILARAFLERAVMQEMGRRAGKGGLRILSEKKLEEKADAAMAQLKENTWEKRISTP